MTVGMKTLRFDEVEVGQELPEFVLEITPTVIVSTAIATRDSNFIFGSTGSGRATLTINGAPVTVAPNGAWLAFLPVPPDGVYRLQATRDGETAALERRVRAPGVSDPGRVDPGDAPGPADRDGRCGGQSEIANADP